MENVFKSNSLEQVKPKYISLHSTRDNCGPIFLKQNFKNHVEKICMDNTSCSENSCICGKALDEKFLKYAFFVPPE